MDHKETPSHFKGKHAMEHVVEVQAKGIVESQEIHGTEIPGHLAAAADAARESSVAFLMLWLLFSALNIPFERSALAFLAFALGWIVWKTARSAWLGWARLERLHRVMAEEKWEIENHREQERSELTALYAAKGFEEPLLKNVIDVLMSDNDRLLRVMLEEELGLTLESQDHPLKQGIYAGLGALLAFSVCGLSLYFFGPLGPLPGALIVSGLAGGLTAFYEKNRLIDAFVWNIAIVLLASGAAYFFIRFLIER